MTRSEEPQPSQPSEEDRERAQALPVAEDGPAPSPSVAAEAGPSADALPPSADAPSPSAGEPSLSAGEPPWGLSFYLFVEPFAVGKVVVDLSTGGGPGSHLLRQSGALDVLSPARPGLPLPFPDAGAELVIAGLRADDLADDGQRLARLSEIRRIVRPDGMCILRVVSDALVASAVGTSLRAALADIVLEHFATVDIVEETPFLAVSFFAPGSDDLAVSEAMAKVAGKPSHFIALCTAAPERTWQLSESLLVPTGPGEGRAADGELSAWQAEVDRLTALNAQIARERDELRERQMMVEDRNQRVGQTVLTLRKDVERYLRQISDAAAARELLQLERDQLRRKLSAVEAELAGGARELEHQKAAVQALRKEVARLRAARGPQSGGGRGPE